MFLRVWRMASALLRQARALSRQLLCERLAQGLPALALRVRDCSLAEAGSTVVQASDASLTLARSLTHAQTPALSLTHAQWLLTMS